MTPKQIKHVERIIKHFNDQVNWKYRQGAIEHGGNLWDRSNIFLLDQAIQENVDQFTYLITLREKMVEDPINLITISEDKDKGPRPASIRLDNSDCTCATNGIGMPRYDYQCPLHGGVGL